MTLVVPTSAMVQLKSSCAVGARFPLKPPSTGVQVVYLGLVPLPDLVPKDRELARALLILHLTLNFALFSLVCVHTAAALKHHFIDRDTVLTRMLPP